MLTRLKVTGFKNLVDTEVRFGPFTCIAGLNGVGKSNVFDAIHFLSQLADHPFVEAACATRGGADITQLFTANGDLRMCFECDLLIPVKGRDDFHQPAEASRTFLSYVLELALTRDDAGLPRVQLVREALDYITRADARERLGFAHSRAWRDDVVHSSQRRSPFIETEGDGQEAVVRLSSDKMRPAPETRRGGGRPARFLARTLPRTVLSAAQNADEARTAVLARAEMRSWRILQLEPSALREPDELQAPSQLGTDGSNLPATLYRIARERDPERVYAEAANRLSELVDDVRELRIDRDDARRVLRLVMTDRAGVQLPASSLSDGTLRFVALSVLEIDPTGQGLLCLEEPENGIHPERMDAMMQLLADMATDPHEPVGDDNPLRQVVVSTHSPVVASRCIEDEFVFASRRDAPGGGLGVRPSLVLRPMAETWRALDGALPVTRGEVLRYLGALRPTAEEAPMLRKRPTVYDAVAKQLDLFGSPT